MKIFIGLILWLLCNSAVLATSYFPNSETLQNGTSALSGSTTSLTTNDTDYRTLRTYSSSYTADYQSTISDVGSSWLTNTTYQDKTTLTWDVPVTGNYLIMGTAEIKRTSTTAARTTKAQMTIDGTTYAEQFVGDDVDVDSYRTFVGTKIINLTAGSHTIKIQYGTTVTSNTGTIKNARIVAVLVGNNYAGTEPPDSTTTSTSYVNIGSISFTPKSNEDWIIISHSELVSSSTTSLNYVNMMVGSTQHAESVLKFSTKDQYLPAGVLDVANYGTGGTVTATIQMKASAGTITYRNVHLYAVPRHIFSEINFSENDVGTTCSTCTSASPTDNLTLNFTPGSSGDYLVIANGEIKTDSLTEYVGARLTIGDTDYGNSIVDVGSTAHWTSFTFQKLINLPNSAQTAKVQLYAQTSGIKVSIRNTMLVAIRMPPASEQMMEVVYSGIADTDTWTSLNWNLVSSWDSASVGTTIQFYNYNSAAYATSGDGYYSYTSNGTPLTEESVGQTISTNPTYFRNGSGNWQVKISGKKTATEWIEFNGDMLEFLPITTIISIGVSDGTVTYGNMGFGESKTTLVGELNDTQRITNNGNATETINIKGQNTACPWVLNSTPSSAAYSHWVSPNGGVGWTTLTTSYQTIYSNLGVGLTFLADLQLKTPTATNCTNQQSVDVIFQAVAP